MPHAVASRFFAGIRRTAAERRRADDHALRSFSALRAGRGFVSFGNAAKGFEAAAFSAFVIVSWHGCESVGSVKSKKAGSIVYSTSVRNCSSFARTRSASSSGGKGLRMTSMSESVSPGA